MEALPPAESREVEAFAAQYPEIQQEIERTQAALNAYALSHATPPRSALKAQILQALPPKPTPTTAAPVKKCNNRLGWIGLSLALLAIIAAVIYYTRAKNLENEVERVVAENQTLQENYNRAVANFEFITNPATKIIALVPPAEAPVAPDASVTIYWNQQDRATLLAIKNLPKPPAGKQYQLWAIKGAQAPKPAGMIDFNALDFQAMDQIREADVFAITLENEGGSPVPTSAIYVAGSVI